MHPNVILIVGAADTGRAPMAAAMLRRLALRAGYDWQIASAGVVGHDGAPPQPETRDALATLNLDLSGHVARSLTDELVAAAQLLIAVDSGIGRVLRARYPAAAITTLGELAGSRRDIPDPFRMQVGAWIYYAREMEQLLARGFARIVALVAPDQAVPAPAAPEPVAIRETASPAVERAAAIDRCTRLLALLSEMPDVIDQSAARERLTTDLAQIAARPLSPADLSAAYIALLQVRLTTSGALPLDLLHPALERLRTPIDQTALTALAAQ
jgi:protein-tyrosine phosphatase